MPRKKNTSPVVDEFNSSPPLKPLRKRTRKAPKPRLPEELDLINQKEAESGIFRPPLAPSPRFYRTIAFSFLGLTVLLVIFVILFTSDRAVISLKLKPQTIKADLNVKVAAKADSIQNQIAGLVLSKVIKGEKTFSPSSGTAIPALASGEVIIYNQSKKNQPLIATTRLLSPNNVLFRLKKSTMVPAGGQVKAEVYADKPGLGGEIEPTRFTIPGLNEILQKDIFAESKTKMTGGTKRISAVTTADLKNAEENLFTTLYSLGQNDLTAQVKASSSLYSANVFTYAKESLKTPVKAGTVTDSFKMEGTVKVVGVFYNPLDLNNLLLNEAQDRLVEGQEMGMAVSAPKIELPQYNLEAKTAEIKTSQEFLSEINFPEELIDKIKLLGQAKNTAMDYLIGLPWIDKVEIKIKPSWSDKIPAEASKVEIKVSE